MPRSPAVRIAAARDIIDFANKFHPGARETILSNLPSEALEALEGGARTAWLSIEHDHWIADGIVGLLGKERAIRCWRASVPDMVDKPLLRSFVSGMLRAFGNGPARVIGLFRKAWPLLFDDFCEIDLRDDHPTQITVLFKDIAPQVRNYPNYFLCWNGVLQGLFEIAEVKGEVDLTIAPDTRKAEARCRWS
jgi:hypothetical protein